MSLLGKLLRRALLSSTLLFLAAAVLYAAESASQTVQIKIGTILASNQSDEFDARLKPLEKQLKVLKYRSYRLLKEETQKVPWQGTATFDIPGGRSLVVSPLEFRDKQTNLKVRWQDGEKPLVDTAITLPNRANFILGGGPPHEGGVLVLSIWATAQ